MTRAPALLLPLLLLCSTACDDDDAPAGPDAGPTADSGASVTDAAVVPDAGPADATVLPFCHAGGTADCKANGGGDCFDGPSVAMTRSDGTTAPDFACGPFTIATSTGTIDVTGLVRDAQSQAAVAGNVAAFPAFDFSAASATDTSDGTGAYALTLPTGTPSRLSWRVTGTGRLDTYTIARPIVVTGAPQTRNLDSWTVGTADALSTFIGLPRVPSSTVVFALVLDCSGHAINHAVVTLSTTSSVGDVCPTFVAGAKTFYFSTASPNLPAARDERIDTNTDGQLLIFDIPPLPAGQTYFLQAWGFPTAADVALGFAGLRLLSEQAIPSPSDSAIVIAPLPTETPF